MKNIAAIAVGLLVLVVGPSTSFSEVSTNALVYQVKLDKEVYALGGPIYMTHLWSNRLTEGIHIETTSGGIDKILFEGKEPLKYKGAAPGIPGPSYDRILPGQSIGGTEEISTLYDFDRVGLYVLQSSYASRKWPSYESSWGGLRNLWEGSITHPDILFRIRRLNDAELKPIRVSAGNGGIPAMRILGAHKDAAGVPDLARVLQSNDEPRQRIAADVLAKIATSNAVNALGWGAVISPAKGIRLHIAILLGGTGNKAAIPWLKQLLKDNYSYEAHVTYENGMSVDKHVRTFIVRRRAKESLKKLGVEDSTPDEEEIPKK